jgi:dihydroorotase
LRAAQDVETLRAALAEGLIDIVATDHAPHSPAEKAMAYAAFADIPGGMPGLQTLLPAMLKLVEEEVIGLADLVRMCARNPAMRFGLGRSKGMIAPGYDADILVLDRRHTSVITHAEQASRAAYTPFDGWSIPARLTRVFLRGEEIVRDGKLVAETRGAIVTREV